MARTINSLGTRFFLASALIVVVAMATAVLVTSWLGDRIARRAMQRDLERSGSVQAAFEEKSLHEVYLMTRFLGTDPPFAAYVEKAISEDEQLSVLSLLDDRQQDMGFDLAIVLDLEGRVFVRTDGGATSRDDLSQEPLVVEALDGFEALGSWVARGRLYYAATAPIVAGGYSQGYLIVGIAIDDDAALQLRQISDTEVSFLLFGPDGPELAASTLDARSAEELVELLGRRPELAAPGERKELTEIALGSRRFLAMSRPLAGASDETIGSIVSLASLEEALSPYRQISNNLLGVGAAAVLLALVVSFFLTRQVLRPVQALASAAKAAAAGDYDQRLTPERQDEVGQLAQAFDTLLSELREKRDMELYINEVARTVAEDEDDEIEPALDSGSGEIGPNADLDPTQQLSASPGPSENPTATLAPVSTPSSPTRSSPTLSGIGPGTLLGQRFRILSQLGAGGMGIVYKARDYSLNELVALKMLKPHVWDDAERLDRLKEELKLARKISHPNVLRTYDFGEIEGTSFISMEYVRGITLRHLLDQSGRLPLSAGLRLSRQLCRGLAAAHSRGVLHRDIKPENLIVEPAGNVKLMDFGIAQKARRRGTQSSVETGEIVGTPYYLAPEQVQGKEADVRSDLYASGVVFYELFTGELPYPKGRLMEIINVKINRPATPPSEHWAAIPEKLEAILLRCLERQPADRYPDVASLLAELEQLRA